MPRINPNLLIAKLEKQLKTLKQREAATRIGAQKRALSKIVKLANSAGLNADAIAAALNKSGTKRRGQNKSKLTSENKRARTKVAPKYRNPADFFAFSATGATININHRRNIRVLLELAFPASAAHAQIF